MSKALVPSSRGAYRFILNRMLVDTSGVGTTYLARMRPATDELRVSEHTALFVDGFPRSANSYAFYGLKYLAPDLPIAGHTHSADQVLRAVGLGVPTLVLLRDPRHVVPSLIQYVPGLPLEVAALAYTRFYRRVASARDGFVLARFDTVTTNMETVVAEVNDRFALNLPVRAFTESDEEAISEQLRSANEFYNAGKSHRLAAPHSERKRHEEILDEAGKRARASLSLATGIYEKLLSTK